MDFLVRGIDDDDARRAGFRGFDGIAAQVADDALQADGFAGSIERAVGEEERLARGFGGFVPRVADREMPQADGVERGVERGEIAVPAERGVEVAGGVGARNGDEAGGVGGGGC